MADATVTSRDPALKAVAMTPSDSLTFQMTKSLWVVGATGATLKVTMADGEVVTFQVPNASGFVLPIRVTRVWATGTASVAQVVALY